MADLAYAARKDSSKIIDPVVTALHGYGALGSVCVIAACREGGGGEGRALRNVALSCRAAACSSPSA